MQREPSTACLVASPHLLAVLRGRPGGPGGLTRAASAGEAPEDLKNRSKEELARMLDRLGLATPEPER